MSIPPPTKMRVKPLEDFAELRNGSITAGTDITVAAGSTLIGATYVAPTNVFFDGADSGFGNGVRRVRIPMSGWRDVHIGIYHNLQIASVNVNLAISLYSWITGAAVTGGVDKIDAALTSLAYTGEAYFASQMAGVGANVNINYCPALLLPMRYLVLEFTPDADPDSGGLRVQVARRS